MEASRARVIASRKLCLSTADLREARVTVNRTFEMPENRGHDDGGDGPGQ
jgi:hypothetical protein